MKPLLVGQAPARSMAPGAPAFIGTDSWKRLDKYLGHHWGNLEDYLDTRNIHDKYPGKTADNHYDRFIDRKLAAGLAHDLLKDESDKGRDIFLIAGLKAWQAIADATSKLLVKPVWLVPAVAWTYANGREAEFWPIPHPGGTNQWWNEPFNRDHFRLVMRPIILGESRFLRAT